MMKEQQSQYVQRMKKQIQKLFPRPTQWSKIEFSVQNSAKLFYNNIIQSKTTRVIKKENAQLFLKQLLRFLSISTRLDKFQIQIWGAIIHDCFGDYAKQKISQGQMYWEGISLINAKQAESKVSQSSTNRNLEFFMNQLDQDESSQDQQSSLFEKYVNIVSIQQVINYLLFNKDLKPNKVNQKTLAFDQNSIYLSLNKDQKKVRFVAKKEDGSFQINKQDFIFFISKQYLPQRLAKKDTIKKLVINYQGQNFTMLIATLRKINNSFKNLKQQEKEEYEKLVFEEMIIFKKNELKQKNVSEIFLRNKNLRVEKDKNSAIEGEKEKKMPQQQQIKIKTNYNQRFSFNFRPEKQAIMPNKSSKCSIYNQFEIVAQLTIKFSQIIQDLRLNKGLSLQLLRKECDLAAQKYYLSPIQFDLIFETWLNHMTLNGYKI